MKTVHGVIHGRSIELESDLGLSDGQPVEVVVTPLTPAAGWGEGVRRSAGRWSGAAGIDEAMEEIARDRKRERRPQ
ncbi:MAG TPA: hypothetical protein VF170_09325 [Planctomycetaceae bacterium]